MPSSKRVGQAEALPQWGRSRTSLNSGGVQLATDMDGFFVEDLAYRPKRRRTTVRWQSMEEAARDVAKDGPSDPDHASDQIPEPVYQDLATNLDAEVQYDMGYTQHERERKVFSSNLLIIETYAVVRF